MPYTPAYPSCVPVESSFLPISATKVCTDIAPLRADGFLLNFRFNATWNKLGADCARRPRRKNQNIVDRLLLNENPWAKSTLRLLHHSKVDSLFAFWMRILEQKPQSTFLHPLGPYNIIKSWVEKSIGALATEANVVPGPRCQTGACVAQPWQEENATQLQRWAVITKLL